MLPRILIIGDVMIDHYIDGNVKRISPEAPVPVVHVTKEYERIGGAGNVAANIASLGGKATCVCLVGNDPGRHILEELCEKIGIIPIFIKDQSRKTVKKTRVVSRNQQLLRLDIESTHDISEDIEENITEHLKKHIKDYDIIVLSDYAKGVITPSLLKKIFPITTAHNIKTIIDPKPRTIRHCKGCFLITPNHIEASGHAGIDENNGEEIITVGKSIQEELDCNVLITRGEKGMALFEKGNEPLLIPTQARHVYDVTGAGDTVTAITALGLAQGMSLSESVRLANRGAGIVVGKPGTETLSKEELYTFRRQ